MQKNKLTLKDVFLKPILNDGSNDFNFTNYNKELYSHPLIIFYDTFNNVYFLQMRSATFIDPNTQQEIYKAKIPNFSFEVNNVKFDYEYTLNKQPTGLPYKTSYVDTSTIFKMKKDDFINYFNIKDINDFNATNILDSKDVINIIYQVSYLLLQQPPQTILNELSVNQNKIINQPLYVDPNLIVINQHDADLIKQQKLQSQQFINCDTMKKKIRFLGFDLQRFHQKLVDKLNLGLSIKPNKKNKTLHEKYLEDI